MSDKYYVQTQARRILKCIYPDDLPQRRVCQKYLNGLSEKRFWKAVSELRNILMDYYSQAEKDPASLNLPLAEIDKFKIFSNEARNSHNSLFDFPNVLLSIGVCAKIKNNGLQAEISEVQKYYSELKSKKFSEQLNRLTDYGFLIDGIDGKKILKSGIIQIEYPDNHDMLTVVAAIGDKFSKYKPYFFKQPKACISINLFEQFIYLTPGIFTDNSETLPLKTIEHMSAAVGKKYGEILLKIVSKFEEREMTLQFDAAFLKNRFFNKKGKDTLNFIEFGDYKSTFPFGNGKMVLRLKLNNPDAYIEKIEKLPSHLQDVFANVWCGNCSEKCNYKIIFHLNGEEKRACGCFFFGFEVKSEKDLKLIMELHDLEQKARGKK